MKLPKKIKDLIIDEETFQIDDIGMSGSSVWMFQDKVLKIQESGELAEREQTIMKWLKGKLPVPEVFAYEVMDNKSYLLMSRCKGKMACAERYMNNPQEQVRLLAQALKLLWKTDISECPADYRLEHKLERARYNAEYNRVDMDNVQPDTFGENGFKDPKELLNWLYENKPEEELVLSHGDFCLPNVMFENGKVSAYIDLGQAGIADKWYDIALCYRSLVNNYNGTYGKSYPGLDAMQLFRELGTEPDWDKMRYYILLDELF